MKSLRIYRSVENNMDEQEKELNLRDKYAEGFDQWYLKATGQNHWFAGKLNKDQNLRDSLLYPPSHLPAGRQGRPCACTWMNAKKKLLRGMSLNGQATNEVGG